MKKEQSKTKNTEVTVHRDAATGTFSMRPKSEQIKIIRQGAEDFATRFEDVMKELANG